MKYTALRHQMDELMERLKPRGSVIRIVAGDRWIGELAVIVGHQAVRGERSDLPYAP